MLWILKKLCVDFIDSRVEWTGGVGTQVGSQKGMFFVILMSFLLIIVAIVKSYILALNFSL